MLGQNFFLVQSWSWEDLVSRFPARLQVPLELGFPPDLQVPLDLLDMPLTPRSGMIVRLKGLAWASSQGGWKTFN